MLQSLGKFVEKDVNQQEYLQIGFSPSSISLQERWRNNGLSADFLADYLSTFFPGDDAAALDRRTELKGAVSYVANELLENAMKFNYAPAQYPVRITMQLDAARVRFYVANSLDPQSLAGFQRFLEELLTGDPDELYMERLMQNAEDETSDGSGLGFLTMLNDYHAELGWKFELIPGNPEAVVVTTMVQLTV
ncbi:MAG: hypothetical protein KF832_00655 [Caldilineaceae bacterium]|nr:hypothetical protein [Caldilineaceae bacterium]